MKQYLNIVVVSVLFFTILFMAFPSVTYAHPGRTDKYGGHTCRTNCPKWGLKYGQYHYHNRGVNR